MPLYFDADATLLFSLLTPHMIITLIPYAAADAADSTFYDTDDATLDVFCLRHAAIVLPLMLRAYLLRELR